MTSTVWTIFRKELKEVVRDRRTLMFSLMFPLVILPLLLELGFSFASKAQRDAASETLRYALFDAEPTPVPGLAEAIKNAPGFELVGFTERDQIVAAINRGELDFVLVAHTAPAPDQAGQAGPQHTVELHYDNARSSDAVKTRVSAVLSALSDEIRMQRLEGLGIAVSAQNRLLEPVAIAERGTADMRAYVGSLVGRGLPYFFIVFCFLGVLYPAVDLGAGEKERGTLETLLLVPVERRSIVLGKFLVAFAAGINSAVLSLLSLGAWAAYRIDSMGGGLVDIGAVLASIDVLDLVLFVLMLVPLAAMMAAALLSLSIYARSFKEAQSFAVPSQFLFIIPATITMVPGVELTWGWAMVPVTNVALATRELVKGTMDYTMLVAILGSSMLLAGLLLSFCAWWFRREAVLFRT